MNITNICAAGTKPPKHEGSDAPPWRPTMSDLEDAARAALFALSGSAQSDPTGLMDERLNDVEAYITALEVRHQLVREALRKLVDASGDAARHPSATTAFYGALQNAHEALEADDE